MNKAVVGRAYLADTVDKSTSHNCAALYSNFISTPFSPPVSVVYICSSKLQISLYSEQRQHFPALAFSI